MSDVVLMANGPGELTTWVRPVATLLRGAVAAAPDLADARLQLVLVPCPNATGREAASAARLGLFEQIFQARLFWNLLLRPRRYRRWHSRGVVVFLGGDQMWSVLLAARLGYRHVCYAEWIARWPRWCDRIGAMGQQAYGLVPERWRARARIVGDLMADVPRVENQGTGGPQASATTIALLPGSKATKLRIGVPFMLATADDLRQHDPSLRFVLPLAPTVTRHDLVRFANQHSPFQVDSGCGAVRLVPPSAADGGWQLRTVAGTTVALLERHPAHGALRRCTLALTTVGANTAELGALALPMLVLLPTQHLQQVRSWDGCQGLLSRLPLLGSAVAMMFVRSRLRRCRFFAWPNIQAREMIVPEYIGAITPDHVARETRALLNQPERLASMGAALRRQRGPQGAASALSRLILDTLRLDRTVRRRRPLPPQP